MGKGWSKTDLYHLDKLVKDGHNNSAIARLLQRTVGSVEHQSRGMRLNRIQETANPTSLPMACSTEESFIDKMEEHLRSLESYKLTRKDRTPPKKGDTLVIHLTDFHAGKIVKDQNGTIYDENIFRKRVEHLCFNIVKLLDNTISQGVPITDVVIIATGDLTNGEDIYATQAYEQEMPPPKQVMLCVDVLVKLMLSFLDRKLPISFYGVRGNHGRTGKETDPTSNWDIMIYKILNFWVETQKLTNKITVDYAENTEALNFKIRGHNYLAMHRAPEQGGTPSGRVKFNAWARANSAKAVVYGHFHHFSVDDVDGVRVFRGGSTVGGDGLSASMAKYSEPTQCVWGVTDDRIMTFFYAIDLNGLKEK